MSTEENPKWVGIGSKYAHLTSVHPCFGVKAHFKVARIHLPIAPSCNIQCNYCTRKIDKCEHRPGVAACILNEEGALRRLEAELKCNPNLKVVGIAGPGDPLANPATFATLSKVTKAHPELVACLSTNGLLAAESAERLKEIGVKTVTITINAIDPKVGAKIYEWVSYDGKIYTGEEAAKLLIEKQMQGIEELVKRGIVVRVNTVLIPSINMEEIPKVAEEASRRGASLMNIIPLIPLHSFIDLKGPTCEELEAARKAAEKYMPQFRLCKQCRADACGVPGVEKVDRQTTEYFHG
jgi:nitrogen fixation protein NifB